MRTSAILAVSALMAALSVTACKKDTSGSTKETKQSLALQAQAANQGMPSIINFFEKGELKTIYELRDDPHYVTYTYYLDTFGNRHKVCPTTGIGYPIPYSVQFTAPKAARMVASLYPDGSEADGWSHEMMDQPEPNGLYMPPATDATWVLCLSPDGKKLDVVYAEPKVLAYPFAMPNVDDGTQKSPFADLATALANHKP